MATSIFSSSEFNRNPSRAKKAAAQGPVLIAQRGKPAYVLLTLEQYLGLGAPSQNIAELLAMPDMGDFELFIPD